MNPTLHLLLCCVLLSFFIPNFIFAQDSHQHGIVIVTDQFTEAELNVLSEYLTTEHSFDIRSACNEKGWLLVEFPTSLSLRMNQAESSIIQAIQYLWQKEATGSEIVSREMVLGCL